MDNGRLEAYRIILVGDCCSQGPLPGHLDGLQELSRCVQSKKQPLGNMEVNAVANEAGISEKGQDM